MTWVGWRPLQPVPARAGCRAVRDSTLVPWYPTLYAPRALILVGPAQTWQAVGLTRNLVVRHEVAHCNGWSGDHPGTGAALAAAEKPVVIGHREFEEPPPPPRRPRYVPPPPPPPGTI